MYLHNKEPLALPDTQSLPDYRGLAVSGAGIGDLRLPVHLHDVDGAAIHTIGRFQVYVGVPPSIRGTHMSRLVAFAEAYASNFCADNLYSVLEHLLDTLNATTGGFRITYPWFLSKIAPQSGVESLLDIEAAIGIRQLPNQSVRITQSVQVPVTTLCPCSKSISKYGAHNQRSQVTITLRPPLPIAVAHLATLIEGEASCELFALLKRSDEKHVTERAYENPKFAEDLARDVYAALFRRYGDCVYSVRVENQESIHNHTAQAWIGNDIWEDSHE